MSDAPREIRVMVVDDHPIVRQGLVSVLGDEDDLAGYRCRGRRRPHVGEHVAGR